MRRQCKACPWRKDCVPDREIPGGYDEDLHRGLQGTIAEGLNLFGHLRVMACHEFPVGAEQVCVGWLANQLGPGNNLAARLRMIQGRFPRFELAGEQHERFEDTLP